MGAHLTQIVKKLRVNAPVASGTSTILSSEVDMAGFDGVTFEANYATGHASNNFIKIQTRGTTTGSWVDVTGTKVLATTVKLAVGVDIVKPLKRYLRSSCARGTASVFGGVIATQYMARTQITSHASAVSFETHASPTTGTA